MSLADEMICWGKLLFERRLVSGWGGNLSCRLNQGEFLITGAHAALGFLSPSDLVQIDRRGRPTSNKRQASSETPMHLAIYKGTDAQVVLHAHPALVIAFSLTHENFTAVSYEEKYTFGEVPIVSHNTATVTRPRVVVEALRRHPLVILKGHGTVAIGTTFQEAFLLTDLLQEAVRSQLTIEGIVNADPFRAPPAHKTKL